MTMTRKEIMEKIAWHLQRIGLEDFCYYEGLNIEDFREAPDQDKTPDQDTDDASEMKL